MLWWMLTLLAIGDLWLAGYTAHVVVEDIRTQLGKHAEDIKKQIEGCRSDLAADIARTERHLENEFRHLSTELLDLKQALDSLELHVDQLQPPAQNFDPDLPLPGR
jgi:phage shock protein A